MGALSGLGADPATQGFEVRDVSLPKGVSDEGSLRFQEMRSAMEAHFRRAETNGTALDTMDEFYKKAYALMGSNQAWAAFSLAGGGIKRGLIYGTSDSTASEAANDPVTIEDSWPRPTDRSGLIPINGSWLRGIARLISYGTVKSSKASSHQA